MSVYRSVRLSLFICAIFGALIACEPGTSPEDATASQYGTVALPLTSVGDLGEVFQIEEAYLSLKGPQSAHIFIDPDAGERFERTIRTGTYTLEVLGSLRMTRRDYQGAIHAFIAELDGPAPTFEITPGQVTPVTLRLISPIYEVPTGEPSTGTLTIETEVTFEEVAVECHPGTFEAIDCGHNLQGRSSRVCEEGQWGEWTPCDAPEGCEPGDSEWMSCVRPDGASGAMNLVCDQDGQWDTDGACAAFVSDDSPGTDQCEPGTFEYSGCELEDGREGEVTIFCDDGEWVAIAECSETLNKELITIEPCTYEGIYEMECETTDDQSGWTLRQCVDGQEIIGHCNVIPMLCDSDAACSQSGHVCSDEGECVPGPIKTPCVLGVKPAAGRFPNTGTLTPTVTVTTNPGCEASWSDDVWSYPPNGFTPDCENLFKGFAGAVETVSEWIGLKDIEIAVLVCEGLPKATDPNKTVTTQALVLQAHCECEDGSYLPNSKLVTYTF